MAERDSCIKPGISDQSNKKGPLFAVFIFQSTISQQIHHSFKPCIYSKISTNTGDVNDHKTVEPDSGMLNYKEDVGERNASVNFLIPVKRTGNLDKEKN